MISNERLDLVQKREQFLKNTFESLGATDEQDCQDKYYVPSMLTFKIRIFFKYSMYFHFICFNLGKKSISSQFKGNNCIESVAQQNVNLESQSKREELQHRIEETRRTLQNVSSFACIYLWLLIYII